ncbi:MAG: glycogen synthase GlgA [Gammaproteobacteria bacterium]|nr:glycogen synthase GlgA [Gammaproteobacteria bacterium]
MSKILFITSEAIPLIKTGGLADVSGALPLALHRLGNDVRLMLPAYPQAKKKLQQPTTVAQLYIPGLPGSVQLIQGKLPNTELSVLLVDYAPAFERDGNPYLDAQGNPWKDNAERFALLARAAQRVAMNEAGLNWQPDVVHCNDWQTALVPALLHNESPRPATLFTIHNLAYQGLFPEETFRALALSDTLWSPTALEFYGQMSFIKGGLVFADRITTVSSNYAAEIQTPEFGCGLQGLLRYRANVLSGIVNGIDQNVWDPQTDPLIAHNYSVEQLHYKSDNKNHLQKHFKLPVSVDHMLIGFVGRMVEQKGIDLIHKVIEHLTDLPIQLAILGSGETRFETALQQAAEKHPKQVGVIIGYDEALAHQIEAGSDAFLMPSRFEPCGLNQLYSLRYGTLPIVHNVGGLADSVTDATPGNINQKRATGVVFYEPTEQALLAAIKRAYEIYNNPQLWTDIISTGMRQQFNWEASAKRYMELYQAAMDARRSIEQNF